MPVPDGRQMSVTSVVEEVHRHLRHRKVRHAFGGALALAYYAEPRGTIDVDLNVFLPHEESARIVSDLGELGFEPEEPAGPRVPIAGIRVRRIDEVAPLDLFFSLCPSGGTRTGSTCAGSPKPTPASTSSTSNAS